MRPKDVFTVGVKLIGVWQIVLGIDELVAVFQIKMGLLTTARTGIGTYAFHAAVYFAVGLFLIAFGTHLFWPVPDEHAPGFDVSPPPPGSDTHQP